MAGPKNIEALTDGVGEARGRPASTMSNKSLADLNFRKAPELGPEYMGPYIAT